MKRTSPVAKRRHSGNAHAQRPYSMALGAPILRSGKMDFLSTSSGSLFMDDYSAIKTPNLLLMKELKRLKRNSSVEVLNSNVFPDFNHESAGDFLLGSHKKKISALRKVNMIPAGPSAETWNVPKSVKKLPILGHVFGVHISQSGICYASVVTNKGERQIQAFDRNVNMIKAFHSRTTKTGKPFEPYQICETPEGMLAVASGSSVTVWSKEGKLVIEHGKNMFKFAKSLAARSTGEIVVADTDNQSVKIISANGQQIYKLDGDFYCPVGVAVDSKDNIIVTDWNDQISVYDNENELVNTFGVKGSNEGELDLPYGVAVDHKDNIVVADMWNHRLSVYNQQGEFLKHLAFETGQSVRMPARISIAPASANATEYRLAVTDFGANCVKMFTY